MTTVPGPTLEPIAVVGMACRVPGAGDIGQFWENLRTGVESVRFFSAEEALTAGASPRRVNNPRHVPAAPILDGIEDFDADQFGLTRREAEILDPAHRVFLECAVAALDHAGYDPARYPGAIGVYGGVGEGEYGWSHLLESRALMSAVGSMAVALANHRDYATTFTSYKLNLRGPSLSVATACSTGLVAVHLACEAVRNGECDMALAGAASVEIKQGWGYVYQEGGILSPDGHCRAFDADAHGTLWGSGGGIVVLKRLSDALADGDTVHAVILGSAINNDGSDKAGFSAPSISGQAAVIREALAVAGVDPAQIGYVEAHGTGTQVGDPIEVKALAEAYGGGKLPAGSCLLGTVKPNIGHLAAGAGIVGLIKAVHALKNRAVPPTLHFRRPNPAIPFENTPFRVSGELEPWTRNGTPLRAGVSSFGMGGTNAHAIVEEPPEQVASEPSGDPCVVVLSANTPSALDTMTAELVAHLRAHPDLALDDVAYTLQHGRRTLPHRLAVVCEDTADAADALGGSAPRRLLTGRAGQPAAPVFLFPGQGAQRVGMAAELYLRYDVVREYLDRGFAVLPQLREVLFAPPGDRKAADRLRHTALTQPAMFLVDYAIARLWRSWGVRPGALLGHSLGEYVAACLAGVFSFEDGLRLVATRARLMGELPPGAMLAIHVAEADLRLDGTGLDLAAVNAPMLSVLSGPEAAIARYEADRAAEGIPSTRLHTSHAFHSAMMEPMLAAFQAEVAKLELRPPQLPVVSNVTGTWLTPEQATDPAYWAQHIRSAVRFGAGITTLLDERHQVFLEVGPGDVLTGLARMQPRAGVPDPVQTMPTPGTDEYASLLGAAGRLWTLGVPVDWAAVQGEPRRRVPLPGHPFERQRHWIEMPAAPTGAEPPTDIDEKQPMAQWFWLPVWNQSAPVRESTVEGRWLVFRAPDGSTDPLVDKLRAEGYDVVTVTPGPTYGRVGDEVTLDADEVGDYGRLLDELVAEERTPTRIVHAWTAGGTAQVDPESVSLAFGSLVWLAQALAPRELGSGLQLTIVSSGAVDVTGDDLHSPVRALVSGPARVLPHEFPGLATRHLDVDELEPGPLLAELTGGNEPVVAHRRGRRWLPSVAPVPLDRPGGGLRRHGTYVITGGLGGVGLSLAEDLAERCGARLVLIGRSDVLTDRAEWVGLAGEPGKTGWQARTLLGIEERGGEVMVLAADVTDPAQLKAVRDRAVAAFGAVHGVIHAAGVPGQTMVEAQARDIFTPVLATKMHGTLALVEAFREDPLDFLALCSSVTSLAGGVGQVDYCAANSFMDAYARSGAAPWPVLSLNWGAWLSVGMAAEVTAPSAFRDMQRGTRQEPIDHPLLDVVRTREGGGRVVCSARMAADTHWVLDEHRIAGVPTMPGTGYLELVRAAFARAQTGRAVELSDVVFLTPLSVPDGTSREVRVTLEDGEFIVDSRGSDGRREHCRGRVRWAEPEPPSTVDLAAIRARCDQPGLTAALASATDGLVSFGSRWDSLRDVHSGVGEGLALLVASDVVATELPRYGLHPAMLDEATVFDRLSEPDARYLPLGYGRLVVHRPLPARVYVHLRHRPQVTSELLTCDLTLMDPTGAVVVEIGEFMLRRIDPAEVAALVTAGAPGTGTGRTGRGLATVTGADPGGTGEEVGIQPWEGGEAFARVLDARLGPQVAVTALHLPTLVAKVARFNRSRITEELAGRAVAEAGSPVLSGDYVAPRTPIEERLVELWEEVTGAVGIGVEHAFFDIGGNSLVATQLLAKVRDTFGVKLPMRVLFESPTVAGMAAAVEASAD